MIKNTIAAGILAIGAMTGTASQAANIDLAFIMDSSGSVGSTAFNNAMDALADALNANIPTSGTNVYRIGVFTFSESATTTAFATIDSPTALADLVQDVKDQSWLGSTTNYKNVFDLVHNTFGTIAGTGLINMMTDGEPNNPGSNTDALNAAKASATVLQADGWDSLSFESVCNSSNCSGQNNLLAGLGFGSGNTPNDANLLPIFTSGAQITDPLTTPFVLDLPNFAAYNDVIGSKVQKIVDPDPVPVPAALPLLAGGLAIFGFVGRRRRQAA